MNKKIFAGFLTLAILIGGTGVASAAPYDFLGNARNASDTEDAPFTLTPSSVSNGLAFMMGFRGTSSGGKYDLFTLGSGIGVSDDIIFVTPNSIETPEGHLTDTFTAMNAATAGKMSTSAVPGAVSTVISSMLSSSTSTLMSTILGMEGNWTATSGPSAILNKPTLFSGAYTDLTGKPTIPATTTPTINTSNRTLNSCFLISSTKDAITSYSVDVDSTVTLSGGAVGQVALTTYTDSGCTTGTTVVSRAKAGLTGTLVIGLTLNNPATVTLGGTVTRGLYAKLVTTNVTGTPTYTMNTTQETLGYLAQ